MREYVKVTINISEGQQENIRDAMQSKKPLSIKLKHTDLRGEHVIAITLQQAKKLVTAWQNGKGAAIKVSKAQLQYNSKIEGGFIRAILQNNSDDKMSFAAGASLCYITHQCA